MTSLKSKQSLRSQICLRTRTANEPVLPDADVQADKVCMRTTLNLNDELIDAAREATGEQEKTKIIHLGLAALVRQKAAERVAKLGGSALTASAAPRKRDWQRRTE